MTWHFDLAEKTKGLDQERDRKQIDREQAEQYRAKHGGLSRREIWNAAAKEVARSAGVKRSAIDRDPELWRQTCRLANSWPKGKR